MTSISDKFIYKYAKNRLSEIDDNFLNILKSVQSGSVLEDFYRSVYYYKKTTLQMKKLSMVDLMALARILDKTLSGCDNIYSMKYITTKPYLVACLNLIIETYENSLEEITDIEEDGNLPDCLDGK